MTADGQLLLSSSRVCVGYVWVNMLTFITPEGEMVESRTQQDTQTTYLCCVTFEFSAEFYKTSPAGLTAVLPTCQFSCRCVKFFLEHRKYLRIRQLMIVQIHIICQWQDNNTCLQDHTNGRELSQK